ncbi:hypothetical protein F2P81_002253 [Scophthalmus maximus]|uniref:Phorbol-ester/DAG-type domain-containing protein n=1 Tax=Scophthalmus maximus TaxID=52904 RepID=A0A6A4TR68_SCOMX|nr:hypothetical protein F2P81_002253 [Scophthalmus maximus]
MHGLRSDITALQIDDKEKRWTLMRKGKGESDECREPDELEGVHTHTFKLKPFKKAKSCDICKQAITKEGLICKVVVVAICCGSKPASTSIGAKELEDLQLSGAQPRPAQLHKYTEEMTSSPDELEGVHTHTFKLKPFKKAKSCDICKQAITKEGLICKACRLSCHRKCEVKPQPSPCERVLLEPPRTLQFGDRCVLVQQRV